jgi:adenylate cyclase
LFQDRPEIHVIVSAAIVLSFFYRSIFFNKGTLYMPAERLDRKVTVILATDVAAYSKHVEQDESLTIKTYSEREAVLLKLIEDFRGRVFNTAGDSVLAEFASAVDAVECAAAFQVQMVEINSQPDTECKLEFRIGINMGDVVQKDGNLGYGISQSLRQSRSSTPCSIKLASMSLISARTFRPVAAFLRCFSSLSLVKFP